MKRVMCRKRYCVILLHELLFGHDHIEGLIRCTQTTINVIKNVLKLVEIFLYVD